jgi:hypothetical protein
VRRSVTSRSSTATVFSALMRRWHSSRERLPGERVHDMQELQDPAVGGLIELEVDCPHLVGARRLAAG